MEHDNGGVVDGEQTQDEEVLLSSEGKKQRKNPSQVQILENAYVVAQNPPATVKEELAKLTGLDYKQVQYWFGNRRYMDRHGPRRYRSRNEGDVRGVNMDGFCSPSFSYNSVSVADSMVGTESSTCRKSEMMQPLVATGAMLVPVDFGMHLPQELQKIVLHVEKKLGHPVRADGPILGVDFKPLPPGAFEAPSAQHRAQLQSCDGKVTERQTLKSVKPYTSLPTSDCCLVTNLSNGATLVSQDDDALNPDGSPKAVQEYQFFPMQPSWLNSYGRSKKDCLLSSVNDSFCEVPPPSSGGQNFTEYGNASSASPCQGQQLNAINQCPKDKRTSFSSDLSGKQKAPNLLYPNTASDPLSRNHHSMQVDNQFLSSDKMIPYHLNLCTSEKIQMSVSTGSNDNLQHDCPETHSMIYAKGRHSGLADVGHTNLRQADHGQNGDATSDLQKGSRKYENSMIVFKETDNKKRKKSIQVNCKHVYDRYFVRPRATPKSSLVIEGGSEISYFSNIDNSVRTLIAEWNEREKKAVYIEHDNESALSWSTGSDSTCAGFDERVTEIGNSDALIKSDDQFVMYTKGDDVHKDQNGLEVMDIDHDTEDDEDDTDYEGYNEMKEDTGFKNINSDIERLTSPLSSEQTV
ncbi:uncharacterized protein LOC122018889 [Zingiber officinale]|uniref:Homeobox domain-containing protein n=1 Tax=Zingiber officinale TaxID=94328 RepID=A0A8J5F5V6_ZINOF|nr:uncharacterized protein LOC122018889 [Zingiber officinale]KAG6480465.1 hypothetical protein ZIOFF_063965 [Zingiber officinale]